LKIIFVETNLVLSTRERNQMSHSEFYETDMTIVDENKRHILFYVWFIAVYFRGENHQNQILSLLRLSVHIIMGKNSQI